MAEYNSARYNAVTVMLAADEKYENVSSTLVRNCLSAGKDISHLCPQAEVIKEYYDKNTKM
jgi:phosphopantetheine adenylyltransferase